MNKQFNMRAAQGELYFRKVKSLPEDVKEIKPNKDGHYIVGHSETGHHHLMEAVQARFYGTNDPLVCYLKIDGEFAHLIHNRSFDKHDTITFSKGVYEVRHQREYTPEGWRRVED